LLQQERYADLLLRVGVNLQHGQGLFLRAELEHAEFARQVVGAAYRAGAKYVHVQWDDDPSVRQRMLHSRPEDLDFVPDYLVAQLTQMLEDGWARLSLVGSAHPDIFDDVEPAVMRRISHARIRKTKFYYDAVMAGQVQWCVAAVPTQRWASQVFPEHSAAESFDLLWQTVLQLARADAEDPVLAWRRHDASLRKIVEYLTQHNVRSLHFFDPVAAEDGSPSTDLVIGLTDAPIWVGASSRTHTGIEFIPNIPTEEVFTSPHSGRVDGWVRTSKPGFPFDRRVENALFHFKEGQVVEFSAALGQDVLDEFFRIPGATRLGEVSLVDMRSPVNQSGVIFFETLFDENAVCHIAFGKAYPEGMEHGVSMSEEERVAAGLNDAETHVDFMIGTSTMDVTGICVDGSHVAIMKSGQFVL
jgi:aminopeptidase